MRSKGGKLHESLSEREAIELEHRMIIDEYFINGFDGIKAVLKYRPYVSRSGASAVFKAISDKVSIKKYIDTKRSEVRSSLQIKQETILMELMAWLRADPTDFLGLTVEELKDLPPEVKKCIQSVKHKKDTGTDRSGNPFVKEYVEVKIVDKLRAMEMINKHIDFYNADNQSKKQTIDISKASDEQLNAVLALMEGQIKSNEEDVIDIDGKEA